MIIPDPDLAKKFWIQLDPNPKTVPYVISRVSDPALHWIYIIESYNSASNSNIKFKKILILLFEV